MTNALASKNQIDDDNPVMETEGPETARARMMEKAKPEATMEPPKTHVKTREEIEEDNRLAKENMKRAQKKDEESKEKHDKAMDGYLNPKKQFMTF